MNFINVGVEQMLKATRDFGFNFVVPPLPTPMRKTFCVTSIKFGTKPLTRAVVSENKYIVSYKSELPFCLFGFLLPRDQKHSAGALEVTDAVREGGIHKVPSQQKQSPCY